MIWLDADLEQMRKSSAWRGIFNNADIEFDTVVCVLASRKRFFATRRRVVLALVRSPLRFVFIVAHRTGTRWSNNSSARVKFNEDLGQLLRDATVCVDRRYVGIYSATDELLLASAAHEYLAKEKNNAAQV